MYPAFAADTHHYALACNDSTTLGVTARAKRSGAQLTLLRAAPNDNHQSTGNLDVRVTVNQNHDLAIELSDAGGTVTYVVHCVPTGFPDIRILTRTAGVTDGLLFMTPFYGFVGSSLGTAFIAILDNNGVPRFQRRNTLPHELRNFRRHAPGVYSVSREVDPGHTGGDWVVDLLDERFAVTDTVSTVSPLTRTGGHDFLITENGNYLFYAYQPAIRDFSMYTDQNDDPYSSQERVFDSVIQEVEPDGDVVFTWNSWDHLKIDPDCRVLLFPKDYAHLKLAATDRGRHRRFIRRLCSGVAHRPLGEHRSGRVAARRHLAAAECRDYLLADYR